MLAFTHFVERYRFYSSGNYLSQYLFCRVGHRISLNILKNTLVNQWAFLLRFSHQIFPATPLSPWHSKRRSWVTKSLPKSMSIQNTGQCQLSSVWRLRLRLGQSDQMSNPLFYTTSMGLKKGRFAAIIPIVLHYHNRFKLSYELKATVLKILRKKFVSENFLSWPATEIALFHSFFFTIINLKDYLA